MTSGTLLLELIRFVQMWRRGAYLDSRRHPPGRYQDEQTRQIQRTFGCCRFVFKLGDCETVELRIRPRTCLDTAQRTWPSLGSLTWRSRTAMFPPTRFALYDLWRFFLLLNLGKPGFSPFFTRRKKFW